mgnify:CR=1 FL=1
MIIKNDNVGDHDESINPAETIYVRCPRCARIMGHALVVCWGCWQTVKHDEPSPEYDAWARARAVRTRRKTRATYTDTRCYAIERTLGIAVAEWADQNSAGWVLDALADPHTAIAAAVAYIPR